MNDSQHDTLRRFLIPALDLADPDQALELARRVKDYSAMIKVGLRLFTMRGLHFLDSLEDHKVFLDLKFHDIPKTVADAVRVVASHPTVHLLTIHASGGAEMVRAAVEAASEVSNGRTKVIAVTALTSLGSPSSIGISTSLNAWVTQLAEHAIDAGAAGLVCSPLEAQSLRQRFPDALLITPGIRPAGSDSDDQVRVATPKSAIDAGSSYLVVGRPIYASQDPLAAIEAIGMSL